MLQISPSQRVALPIIGAAAVLAGVNWYMQPERWPAWMAVLVLLGVMVEVWRRKVRGAEGGIATAGLILVLSLGTVLTARLGGSLGEAVGERGTMVLFGLFLMVTANAIPKKLTPLSSQTCDALKAQSTRRIVGWTWTLTGLAVTLTWLAAPLSVAPALSGAFVLTGLLIGTAQIVRLRGARRMNYGRSG